MLSLAQNLSLSTAAGGTSWRFVTCCKSSVQLAGMYRMRGLTCQQPFKVLQLALTIYEFSSRIVPYNL